MWRGFFQRMILAIAKSGANSWIFESGERNGLFGAHETAGPIASDC
jgi:hypothetical protein